MRLKVNARYTVKSQLIKKKYCEIQSHIDIINLKSMREYGKVAGIKNSQNG